MDPIRVLLRLIRGALRDRSELALENLALRQQLAALQHKSKRSRLRKRDRVFWALLSRVWANWRSANIIVQTVLWLSVRFDELSQAVIKQLLPARPK